MIDRQHGRILIECDSCPEVYEGEPGEEFTAIWAAAKREGWRTKKIGEEWVHGCGKCKV
jgi:hypothetical protein